jgi:hypothetical protein
LLLLTAVLAAGEWATAPMDSESGAGFGCLTHGAAFTPLFYRSLLGRAQRTGAFDIP